MQSTKKRPSVVLIDDYYISNLSIIMDNADGRTISVYGEKHRKHLKMHKRVTYYNLLTSGKLHSYIAGLNEQAQDEALVVKQMAEKQSVTE